jgi:DTW domain-containing protein YfiP
MHPKEFKHIKNNTGRLTHMSLKNSELFIGVDFSNHKKIKNIIDNKNNYCTVLYPSDTSIQINNYKLPLENKQLVIFIIDATWASSKPMLRLSKNLQKLPKISFTHKKTSLYSFKKQPFTEALSTMESTLCILEILNKQNIESISTLNLKLFLKPFEEMIKFQTTFSKKKPRFKINN